MSSNIHRGADQFTWTGLLSGHNTMHFAVQWYSHWRDGSQVFEQIFHQQWCSGFSLKAYLFIYRKEQAIKGIGEKLGELIAWDVNDAKVRVSVECENPLQFERRVQFSATGDEVVVTFKYDKLQKWCFICQRMCHDGRRCSNLEKERSSMAKYGNGDRNLKQQAILRGDASHYIGNGKSSKNHGKTKPPVSRKLFSEKQVSQRRKYEKSQDKRGKEPTKTWILCSFGEGSKRDASKDDGSKDLKSDGDLNKGKNKVFQPLSWYHSPKEVKEKAASDPGKVLNHRSPPSGPHKPNQDDIGKGHVLPSLSSADSQSGPGTVELEEVISPLKDMMISKSLTTMNPLITVWVGEEIPSKVGLDFGARPNVSLQVKKKISRSPVKRISSRKHQKLKQNRHPRRRSRKMRQIWRNLKSWWLRRYHRQIENDPKL